MEVGFETRPEIVIPHTFCQSKSHYDTVIHLRLGIHRLDIFNEAGAFSQQRFQVGGEITQAEIDGLLSELKTRVRALVEANGATITGGVGASILDRPIASLALTGIRPKVNCAGLLGFSLQYEDAGGMGAVDVMATRIESEEDAESWEVGLVIHEPANAE